MNAAANIFLGQVPKIWFLNHSHFNAIIYKLNLDWSAPADSTFPPENDQIGNSRRHDGRIRHNSRLQSLNMTLSTIEIASHSTTRLGTGGLHQFRNQRFPVAIGVGDGRSGRFGPFKITLPRDGEISNQSRWYQGAKRVSHQLSA